MNTRNFKLLQEKIEGEVFTDTKSLILYSTDASAYREMPVAVVIPKVNNDIKECILFANNNKTCIIPRTAGTSLAGQVVGNGIVVDVSKHFSKILEVNTAEHWVRVQPGVVLDELNLYLKSYGLFFGPETSTSNRCMIGGMVGNNACGAHSIIYGSTREHTLEIKGYLSDGSEVHFKPLTNTEFEEKCKLNSLEGFIYSNLKNMLSKPENARQIIDEYPEPLVKRRNTGYAIDLLLNTEPFTPNTEMFNMCKLVAGSEGTLVFATEIKLNLVPLPPKEKGLICIHCHTLEQALEGNLIALKYQPGSIELIDDIILQCTKNNIEQRKNRFFIEGDPGAILIVEFARDTHAEIEHIKANMEAEMRAAGYGYHFPMITGTDIAKVWALRKAALGLLANIKGDAKPVSLVEDTAVHPELMPKYIAEFKQMLNKYGLTSVFHAHIATGELHLRPVINIKDEAGLKLFRQVATDTAHLVKKYRGSLSGEHGDGRLRGEFIPIIIGEHNYQLCKQIKQTWDTNGILNPGKITDTPAMDSSLRYKPGTLTRNIETIFDFSDTNGILGAAEQCNGSGDCRKSALIGGVMCPSYMVTRNENDVTRARANILREYLTHSQKTNPFDHKEIYDVLDLCLSCKGCKSECPSNVDMAKLKAEFLQHYYDANGVPLRSWLIANITVFNKLGSSLPYVYNCILLGKFTSVIFSKLFGFALQRKFPLLAKQTLKNWAKTSVLHLNNINKPKGNVYLFADEFTNYNDVPIGIAAIELLTRLGYNVQLAPISESGRTYLSKGLLRKARAIATKNVNKLYPLINADNILIGLEPSAILTFRDEYPDLLRAEMQEKARKLGENSLLLEEFIMREVAKGNISSEQFTSKSEQIKLHGHCQQKSIASTLPLRQMLSLPVNYTVNEIPSGCCGMAGSFGYEAEHYEISNKIGELVLFPDVRKTPENVIVTAPGTSCRHHIKDGTGRVALHPVIIMLNALKS